MIIDDQSVAGYTAERLDRRLAEFQALVARSHPTNDPAELHQLRIAAKRVRYLLEIVSEIGYGDASRPLAWLRTLQDRIGDWHDLEALEEEIIAIISNHEFLKQNLAESGQMLQACIGNSCFGKIQICEVQGPSQVAQSDICDLCLRQIEVFKARQVGQAFQPTIRDVRFCEAKHVEVFEFPDVTQAFVRSWSLREVDPHDAFKIPWPPFSDPFRHPVWTVERCLNVSVAPLDLSNRQVLVVGRNEERHCACRDEERHGRQSEPSRPGQTNREAAGSGRRRIGGCISHAAILSLSAFNLNRSHNTRTPRRVASGRSSWDFDVPGTKPYRAIYRVDRPKESHPEGFTSAEHSSDGPPAG